MFKRYLKKLSFLKSSLGLGIALVAIGVVLAGISLFNTLRAQQTVTPPVKPAFSSTPVAVNATVTPISGTPVSINIPSLNILLHVIPGYYYPQTNSWTLSLTDAQYATMTTPPNNQSGLTFIYAHARIDDFGPLPKIQPGGQAIVATSNGHIFTYSYQYNTVISPEDTSLFTYKGKPILVLQTCTGPVWQYRQLFTFNLSKAV